MTVILGIAAALLLAVGVGCLIPLAVTRPAERRARAAFARLDALIDPRSPLHRYKPRRHRK